MIGQSYIEIIDTLKLQFCNENPPTFPRAYLDKATGQKGFHRTFANMMASKDYFLPEGIALRKGNRVYIVRDIFAEWYFSQFENITSVTGGRNV
jgi:hypothetical protein